MDGRLLRRTQWTTLLLGAVVAGTLALLGKPDPAQGLAIGSAWAAVNLRALEGLLTAAIRPRDGDRDLPRLFLWSLTKLGVYVLAVWLLNVAPFPVASMVHGLTVMLIALVFTSVAPNVVAGPNSLPKPGREATQIDSERGDDAQA